MRFSRPLATFVIWFTALCVDSFRHHIVAVLPDAPHISSSSLFSDVCPHHVFRSLRHSTLRMVNMGMVYVTGILERPIDGEVT